jgi:hypothetical protein
MAQLRNLDEKLAEVIGLARAAKGATDRVARLAAQDDHRQMLKQMGAEATETARRCEAALDDDAFGGRKTAIMSQARATRNEASQMMETYLTEDSDELDGFEFLIMSEAGEAGHWRILQTLNDRAKIGAVKKAAEFAIPVQERHEQIARETAQAIAGAEDPMATA